MNDSNVDDAFNPYRSPEWPDTFQEPVASAARRKWFRVMLVAQCVVIIGGAIAAWTEIETIMVSGAIVFFLGIAVTVGAALCQNTVGTCVGLSGPVFAVFCFGLIFVNEWSPGQAQEPVSMLIIMYAVLAVTAAVYALITVQPEKSSEL